MTISTTTIINSYSGDGSTTAFTYTFKITDQDDIEVLIRSNDGTETTKTITTHYTVSGVGNAGGGTVTFTSGNIPTSTQTVVLRRSTPQTQTMDLIDNDPMSADTIETAHDKAIAISQELQEQVNRSIKFSRTNTYTSSEFTVDAATRSNKILAFDSSGEIAVTQELGTYKGNWTTATAYYGRDLVKDSSNNNIYICITAHTSSGAVPISSNADSAKWSLLVDAASATSSASAAATSETNASNSATAAAASEAAAATSESNALSYKTDAETAKTASETAQTAAENAQAAAEAALDTFDDKFLGAKATDPTLDNDGNLWFDTTNNVMKVYGSGGFVTAASSINGTASRHKFTATSGQTTFTVDDDGNNLAYDAPYLDTYLNGVKLVNTLDFTATSGTSIVLASGAATNDILEVVAYGTFELANFSINDANDVSTAGITDGQVLTWNASSSTFQAGNASSAEVYGFNKDASGNLIVTTTDGGNDNISSATYASFDDVLFAASGFTFSLSNGDLIATI
jgi:hypothetical protein